MKKIKQRLKKLTLFDYLLILIFISGGIIFAYIFFRKPAYIDVTVKVAEENVNWGLADTRDWFSQLFHAGMKEKDGIGKIQAEVINVLSYDTSPDRHAVYVTLKLRGVYDRPSNRFTFKGKPLLIGYPIKLMLDSLNVEGLVVGMQGVADPRQHITLDIEAQMINENSVFLETYGVSKSISDAIKIGDAVLDSQGNTVLQITGKNSSDAKKLVTTSDGRVVIGINPFLKDVSLQIRANAIKINNKYYLFDDIPLLVDGRIPINLPFLSVLPKITKITEIK